VLNVPCGLRSRTVVRSISAFEMVPDPGRNLRLSAYRIFYRDCGILLARDFERGLRMRLPQGSNFFGRRFIASSGCVYYNVVVDLLGRTRVSSAVLSFGLPGDGAAVEVLRAPLRGESSMVFLRR